MKGSRVWLAITILAFAAWIGYLFYLTRGVERPPIHLSRPQFQIADLVVVAHLEDKDGPAVVSEVIFSAHERVKPGDVIQAPNLRHSFQKWLTDGENTEWDVPGDFIVPFYGVRRKNNDGPWTADVVPLPPSPGLPHGTRIYPVTPSTMREVHAIQIGTQ